MPPGSSVCDRVERLVFCVCPVGLLPEHDAAALAWDPCRHLPLVTRRLWLRPVAAVPNDDGGQTERDDLGYSKVPVVSIKICAAKVRQETAEPSRPDAQVVARRGIHNAAKEEDAEVECPSLLELLGELRAWRYRYR